MSENPMWMSWINERPNATLMKPADRLKLIPHDRVERTIATYDNIADRYHLANTVERRERKQFSMRIFMHMVYERCLSGEAPDVLVPACGLGDDAAYLTMQGAQVVAFDLSPGMLEQAKQADPLGDYRLLDLREMDKLEELYEGVWARGCLYHLTPTELEEWFKSCHALLRTRGVLYFSLKEGAGEEMRIVPAVGYSGGEVAILNLQGERYYSYYTPEQVRTMFEAYFTVQRFERMFNAQPAFEFWLERK